MTRWTLAALLAAISASANAQVSCSLTAYALLVFVPGGGFQVAGGPDAIVAPGSSVSLGVYCEFAGQFPPPTIQGATYAWSNGASGQRIEVAAPAAGISATYSVTVSAPTGNQTLSATIKGAAAGTPRCTLKAETPAQPIPPDSQVIITADCSPQATASRWRVASFLGNIELLGSGPNVALVRIMNTQPGDVLPVYAVPSNDAGEGQPVSVMLVAGNPAGALPANAPALAAGGTHTCALNTGGGAKCWGSDSGGQLGDYAGAIISSTAPQNVIASANVVAVAAGFVHSCALYKDGAVRCWGENSSGQLGDGTTQRFGLPARVPGIVDAVDVSASPGGAHTCAALRNGDLACWGNNERGQLGDPALPRTYANQAFFVPALFGQVRAVSAGGFHTCAILANDSVRCWGRNVEGQLGNGSTVDSATPVVVPGLAGVRMLSGGTFHTCALTTNGRVKCWGSNDDGQLGIGSTTASTVPVDVPGLDGIVRLSAGGKHTCALRNDGRLWCWGRNTEGQLGDGSLGMRALPIPVPGIASSVADVSAGAVHTCALISGGGVECWGQNYDGRVGDGTAANRVTPQLVLGVRGEGFLDLTLENGFQPPPEKLPVFRALTTASSANNIAASIQFRPEDVGTAGTVYVFALAPPDRVLGATASKDTPVACVLAQLNSSGQLQAVSAANLQAYVSGVLSGQGQAVTIVNGVPVANIAGATFYVGYGPNATSMFRNGNNRSVASLPGSTPCVPQAPQMGWWWNPSEPGRGYSIEMSGSRIFFAAYLYDVSGRATWTIAAGNTSLDGSVYQGRLESYAGGQSLAGTYRPPNPATYIGDITLAFSDATRGTLSWPGGTIPIQRFEITPGGLGTNPPATQPESGWWWNPAESGRGFFLEWQGGQLFMAGYMYDDAGNPIWYLSTNTTPSTNLQAHNGAWWLYGNGQTLTGSYRAPVQVSNNVAPVTIQFSGPETGIMTLPNGRTTAIRRFRF